MGFIIYDLIFLVLFALAVGIFLYIGKKNIKKEGLLLLYKASWGIKLINYVGGKYKRTLNFLSYVAIGLGYILMAMMVYLFGKIVYIYAIMPNLVQAIKIPPIMPLIPYIDKVVPNLGLPPFYFIYWILILAVVAIPHEFFHGIFMKRSGVKIKATGFGFFPFFLPIFLAAFVEQDEKSFEKSSNFNQMAILAAGTFANILTAIFFFFIMWGFFAAAFTPAGVVFDNYAYSPVAVAGITMVNGISLDNPTYDNILELMNEDGWNRIIVENENYLVSKSMLAQQKNKEGIIMLYSDSPAINANLSGAIYEIGNVFIDSTEKLSTEISNYDVGEEILIKTINAEGDIEEYEIILEEHPENPEKGWVGIAFRDNSRSGIMGKIIDTMSSFKDPHIHYEAKYDGLSKFIYNLLWWAVLICISVALVNMLPVGIFDGGRFFYLTVLGITGSEVAAKKSFKFVTWFFLFLLAVLMAFWVVSFF